MTLKEKLLSLGYFEDNQFLDFYCALIEQNKSNKKQIHQTELHHIIPRAVFKLLNKNSVSKSHTAEVNKNNLIHLSYKDHALAHYYLALCSKNEYKKSACFTFTRMIANIYKDKRPKLEDIEEIDLTKYEELRLEAVKLMLENPKLQNKYSYDIDKEKISKEDLYKYYIIEDHSYAECLEHFNTSIAVMRKLMKEYNIYKNIYKNMGQNPELKNIITKDKLYNYYIVENHSWHETLKYFGISQGVLCKLLKEYQIKKGLSQRRDLIKKNI